MELVNYKVDKNMRYEVRSYIAEQTDVRFRAMIWFNVCEDDSRSSVDSVMQEVYHLL